MSSTILAIELWPSDQIPECLSDLPWKLGTMLAQEYRGAGKPTHGVTRLQHSDHPPTLSWH